MALVLVNSIGALVASFSSSSVDLPDTMIYWVLRPVLVGCWIGLDVWLRRSLASRMLFPLDILLLVGALRVLFAAVLLMRWTNRISFHSQAPLLRS